MSDNRTVFGIDLGTTYSATVILQPNSTYVPFQAGNRGLFGEQYCT
jgi:molecular chaperone DnaK (HSP70)